MIPRLGLLGIAGAVCAVGWLPIGHPAGVGDPLAGERLYRDVVRYVELGEHRTGTTVDLATSAWIAGELAKAGLQVDIAPFAVRVFDLADCWVEAGGHRYPCYPEWYPTATGREPVVGELVQLKEGEPVTALSGKVWLVEAPSARGVGREFRERLVAAGEAGAEAVVVISPHPSGELAGRSTGAPWREGPWSPIPIVNVASKHGDELAEASRSGAAAGVLLQGVDREDGTALTVVGRIGTGERLIVVTTPSSGLSFCGGERGPGVALLLGLARWVGQRDLPVRYLFSANSGHELMGLGAYALVEQVPPPQEVHAWLHLGSGIATWEWQGTPAGLERRNVRGGIRSFVCAPELRSLLEGSFADVEGVTPRTVAAGGELEAYLRLGYRAFGFFGGNRFVHSVVDRADQTAPELLEPVARGLAAALEAIETTEF